MTESHDNTGSDPGTRPRVAGFGVMSVEPNEYTTLAAAMLVAMFANQGANVAAMVPVETGIDEPCAPGSRGALVRWAAGHLDSPRLVTPFALVADQSAMHAADASGTLLHPAAFDRARDELCDGRTTLVVLDAIGPMDPITPSLTMRDLFARWDLKVVIVVPASRWAISTARIVQAILLPQDLRVAAVILAPNDTDTVVADDALTAIEDTIAAVLGCPVVRLPRVLSTHDRAELLAAADACALHRIARHPSP